MWSRFGATRAGSVAGAFQFTDDGFVAQNVSLLTMVNEAYGIFQNDHIFGMPKALAAETFDVSAKIDSADTETFQKMDLAEHRLMLQRLLAERFHLEVRRKFQPMAVFALVVDKRGFKLKDTRVPGTYYTNAPSGWVTQSRRGFISVKLFTMHALAQDLTDWVGRTVVDKTGLDGRYDFDLRWSPEETVTTQAATPTPEDSSAPSIYSALSEQLGLRLVAAVAPVEMLEIVNAQEPSEN